MRDDVRLRLTAGMREFIEANADWLTVFELHAHPQDGLLPGSLPTFERSRVTWAGTGHAMANAHPAVRAVVPRHTASIEGDGVAKVLESLFTTRQA
ncbi:hypothetical protein MBT84_03995 [Streptomyces sp. MBT84]|nr:hypothetical protein [Streptomyces sp. MBT84]